MSDKKIDSIDASDSEKICIQDKHNPVKMDPADMLGSDIDDGSDHVVVIERTKQNTSVIDLTGTNKTKISGVQPDIRGPHHRHNLLYYLRRGWYVWAQFWRQIPFIVRGPLSLLILGSCFLIFLFFFQYRLTTQTYNTYQRLFDLGSSGNIALEIESIRQDFSRLSRNFSLIRYIGDNPLISHPGIQDAHSIISGGHELTKAIEFSWDLFEQGRIIYANPERNFTEWSKKQHRKLQKIHTHLDRAIAHYEKVHPESFPNTASMEGFLHRKKQLMQGQKMLGIVLSDYDSYLEFLGSKEPKNILILNQNQDELRASGGFPGSAGLIRIYEGKIESWEMKDIYALDWSLLPTEASPEGINQFLEHPDSSEPIKLNIRDANYSPLFHENAKKINELMQQASWGNIDILVGINQSLIEEILAISGPISLQELPIPITSANFNIIVSSLVESKAFAKNSPKDILFAFGEEFITRIQSSEEISSMLQILWTQLNQGEILVAHVNPETQKHIDNLEFFEPWRYDQGDWIYPVFTSVSKNKSDRHMKRQFFIKHHADYLCSKRFELIQSHQYDSATDFEIERIYRQLDLETDLEALKHVQGKGINRQYIRLLLPPGSKITDTHGFVLNQIQTKTYTQIAWYQTTPTGKTSNIYFDYMPPNGTCHETTWMYKQPGLDRATYHITPASGKSESHQF